LIAGRRANGALFQTWMSNHPKFIIQEEIGESSWFGFSLVLRPGAGLDRREVVRDLTALGFECRPIVAGNFAKNEVMSYFDHEIHGSLNNAEHIDQNGFFVGNHHYPIAEAIEILVNA